MSIFEKLMFVVLVLLAVIALPNIINKTVSEWEPQPNAHERIRAAVKKNWGI